MADLVLGLAKTTVEGTVTMARLAMEEEDKLKKSVQRDLLVISDEFEMMHAFLTDAKGRVTDNVTRTLVRQVRNTALDVEDCIETIVHLDNKSHWWRRMMFPWCMPAAPPGKDLDAVVANVEQLKARVDAMALRRLRYNRVDDCCHKPAEHQRAIATGAVTGSAKQLSCQVDLISLINGKGGAEGGQGNNNDDEKKEEKGKNEQAMGDETEEAGNEAKGEQKTVDDVPELKIISVLGTGSDRDMMFIKRAYDCPTTCGNFKCRAWVKPVHPLNPIEFIRSLLAQFQKNARQEQGNTVKVLEAIVVPDDVLIEMFMTQISQKYLVVLEDVSTMVDWEAVTGYLPDNKDGSCIVVHTRHHGIAFSCVGQQYRELEMLVADHSVVKVIIKEGVAGKDSDEDTVNGKESKYEDWERKNPLYGREEDLRWLSDFMYSIRLRLRLGSSYVGLGSSYVVSVWGMSGVGKSFLIQHFYRMPMVKDNMNFFWVNVSRPLDLRDVRKRLPSELLNPGPEGSNPGPKGSNPGPEGYFIVIDGLQSTEEWDSIRKVFKSTTTPQKSSDARTRIPDNVFIIIITDEESVANYCATPLNQGERCVRNVKSLEVDHAIKLFDQVAEKSDYWDRDQEDEERRYRSKQTKDILLNKCGGFPKVICAVAESWRMFRNIKVKDNLVPKLEANPQLSLEGMFSWLLAYFGSCPDSLKPCIFYLTIFPVNHTIRRRRLVRRWIMEGYTGDNKQITAEETANEFFTRLVKLNMIQPPRGLRYLPSSTRMPLCQVNGFLREYVISRSMEENFVFELEGNCKNLQRDPGTDNHYIIKGEDMSCVVQHLAIDKSWDRNRNVFESIDFSRLRSLTVFGRWESFLISDKMGRLRVLDLEDVSSGLTDDDVETMVKRLPRLKFLSLRRCAEINRLPSSLGDLKQLQTLDIRGTSVVNLPKSIIKLEKLQYIRAGRTVILDNDDHTAGTFGSLPVVAAAAANPSTSATPMRRPRATLGSCMSKLSIHRRLYGDPHNGINVLRGIGELSSLHTLGVVNISAAGGEDFLDELKNLTLLHKLGVCGINRNISEKFFSAIPRLAHLESLCLQFQLNQDHEAAIRLSPLVKLRSLKLYGLADRLPTWIMQMFSQLCMPRLEKLDLQMRKLPQQELDSILTLRHLHILRLRLAEFEDEELRFGWSIDQSFVGRWYLNFLEISCNSRLQAVRFASSLEIKILKIRCSSVSSSLQFFGLCAMSQLKEVWLSGSYGDALEKRLKDELDKCRNGIKPVLLPEGTA